MRKIYFLYALPIGSILLAGCGGGDTTQVGDSGNADVVGSSTEDGGALDAASGEDVADVTAVPPPPADGSTPDGNTKPDGGSEGPDAGGPDAEAMDAEADVGQTVDASPDAGGPDGSFVDSSAPVDAGILGDGGVVMDSGTTIDAGVTYAVGGTVSGLAPGDSIVLQNNLGDNVTVSSNTSFVFPTQLGNGVGYSVTTSSPTTPVSQACSVSANGSGNVAGAAVTGIVVTCQTNQFTIGATVTGVATGETVTLADDAGDSVVVGNGSFAFATPYKSGGTYTVSVTSEPTAPILQTCTVSDPTDTVRNANANLAVTCTTNPYALGGAVHGLATGKNIVLTETVSGQTLGVSTNGVFTFNGLIPNGSAYSTVVSTQPTNVVSDPTPQVCNVVAGAGTMPQSAVTTVQVYCGTNCEAVHGVYPSFGSGNFEIDPDGSDPGVAYQAYCDMSFQGGGWTLVESTNGGNCGPGSEVAGQVVQGTCRYTPLASVEALAKLGTTVHVRTANGAVDPTQYVTSATALPIGNLRIGALLDANEGPSVAEAQWTTVNVPATALDFSAGCINGPTGWPNVYWACGNESGWHLVSPANQGNYSTWHWQQPNVGMEVYVR